MHEWLLQAFHSGLSILTWSLVVAGRGVQSPARGKVVS